MIINSKTMIASVTHDLKTPISAQINMFNLLLKGSFGELNEKQQEIINLTFNSSKYMSNLVKTILTETEYDYTKIKLNFSEFDLTEIIRSTCITNKSLYKQKNQKLILNFNCGNYVINGDKIHIERVISNLLSNAITYGFENSKIIINLVQKDNIVDFSVSNQSYYIEKEELKNIFNKFSKTKNSKLNKNSNGLGLYIARRIISLHKGEVYAKSTTDGVCTFGFKLKSKNKHNKNIPQKV